VYDFPPGRLEPSSTAAGRWFWLARCLAAFTLTTVSDTEHRQLPLCMSAAATGAVDRIIHLIHASQGVKSLLTFLAKIFINRHITSSFPF
jgi:uncharacterized membrane protein YjjB (DUF3815 family)